MIDNITLTGALTITIKNEFGCITHQESVKNLIVTSGKNLIAAVLAGDDTLFPNVIALGSSSTIATLEQTTLFTELARVNMSSVSSINNIVSYSATFPAGMATGTLTEAAIFNGSLSINNGNMLSRTVFLPVIKPATSSLIINWQITIN